MNTQVVVVVVAAVVAAVQPGVSLGGVSDGERLQETIVTAGKK